MLRSSLLLGFILIVFPNSPHAGEFVANCDNGAADRDKCLEWAQKSLKALGCSVAPTTAPQACRVHPWGSDFTKSWLCSVASSDCDPIAHGGSACLEGRVHLFKDQWDVCKKIAAKTQFEGVCRQEAATHTSVVTSCPESISICGKLGGERESLSVLCERNALREPLNIQGEPYGCAEVAKRCTDTGGQLLNDWKVVCKFRDLKVQRTAKSCEDIRARCERGNSTNGPRGTLESCVGL